MKNSENPETTQVDELLNAEQVCKLLNLKRSMLNSLIFKRRIPVIRIGKCLRFDKKKIAEWVESMTDLPVK